MHNTQLHTILLCKPSTMTYPQATKNERWSAMSQVDNDCFNAFSSPRTEKMPLTKSQHLLHTLRQDFGKSPSFIPEELTPQSLLRPRRMPSNSSFGSMSTISSAESFASLNNHRFKPVKNSKNSLLRYNNMDSKGSLVSLNNRWRATPSTTKGSNTKSNRNKLCASLNMPMPVASGNHQRRWMATVGSDNGSDQPIGMITRKSSATYLFPASSA
mmetsp:Transcript_793/g.1939  ORF Transcript_793/g.1939 Transcript_793/m.1939 type:complete len:214 (+) Transcript_793:79-720(+)